MNANRTYFLMAWFLFGLCKNAAATGNVERFVVIKADGLPFEAVERSVREKDPATGKSVLPWIDHVFYENGTRLSNFYSRGLSLSATSWAILDTGQHSLIKGNVEFDRLTLDAYDYLNIFSFVLRNSTRRSTDTVASMLLDEYGIPRISDAYPVTARFKTVQLIARGVNSLPLAGSLKRLLTLQSPREWLAEWTIGLTGEKLLFEILEKELVAKLKDPKIRYFEFLVPLFDHTAHITRDTEAQVSEIRRIDATIGRIWMAIQTTPLAATTAIILVSDHGMNTDPQIYSQSFSLIDFFGSTLGGGHHALTNRPPQGAYSIKSLLPAVRPVVTASAASYYLKNQSSEYPTLALDADGNERASIYFRQSDLNILHILWQQLQRKQLSADVRSAAIKAFISTIESNRIHWEKLATELEQELNVVMPATSRYRPYAHALTNLLALNADRLNAAADKTQDLIPKRAFGDLNSIHDLQNYVVGLGSQGLVLNEDGSLDMLNSFFRVNYFSLLQQMRTKNNVQPSVASRPVDFIATRVAADSLGSAPAAGQITTAVWLFKDVENQALILARTGSNRQPQLKYVPIRNLEQDDMGNIHFEKAAWRAELPLAVWRDLPLRSDLRAQWLDEWHTEREWFDALHSTEYSNAVIDLYEQFSDYIPARSGSFQNRKRELARPDLIVFARNHWNFNFRGFNPGGNHGGFFRSSTHATLMIAGGSETRVPKGVLVERPYDALSFAPTVLALGGKGNENSMPGPIICELLERCLN